MLGSYLFYTHLASRGRNRFKRNLERLALLDDETVREGRDSQHVQQRRLRRSDFVTDLDEVNLVLQVQTRDVTG